MKTYKDWKELYKDLPHLARTAFWIVLFLAILILMPLGYYHHRKDCNENKQSEFLICMKCFPKPDTVIVNQIEYRDTCLEETPIFDNKENQGVQSINQKGGQTAKDITNTYN